MPSEGTTVTSAPGPSGEQNKKLRHRLDDVGADKFQDADDYEACEPYFGDFPSAKRSKPTASNAVMECDDESAEDENFKVHTTEENSGSRRTQSCSRRKIDHAEDIRLEDYLPEYLIDSHEKRDSCSLAITMTHTARSVDITELSGDIIKLVFKGNKAFVRYMDPETAAG
ncbi:hypothetical protein MTO96_020171 [Rhipicephalus appendiculatus]